MPNKTVYLNTIKEFEKTVGFSIIDSDEVSAKLQKAWGLDKTEAKLDYLVAYGEVFHDVLSKWADNEIYRAIEAHTQEMPNFKKCLLKTEEALKLCAMALIPALRENEDVLSHMTFGVIESTKLKDEFVSVRTQYLNAKTSGKMVEKRKAAAYDKHNGDKATTRKIVDLAWDKEALNLMSQEEKIDYALALEAYRERANQNAPIDSRGKELIEEALLVMKQEIGCARDEIVAEFVAGQYYAYAQKLGEEEWLDAQVNEAITEYNQSPNPAKQEIERYKEVERTTEKVDSAPAITDDAAEMVGDFFMQEELQQEVKEIPNRKERVFLQDAVEKFNRDYSLDINHNKLRTSVEQLSALMIEARKEKERFLDEDSVVVIENGKETCYTAREYYKDKIDEANKAYAQELQKIETERQREEEKHNELLKKIEKQAQVADKQIAEMSEKLKADAIKTFNEKREDFEKALAKANAELKESMSIVKGGIVIEKNGDKSRQYASSRYYETHETQKEQYAYGQYQLAFSLVYKDACKNIKERNYVEGRMSDFSSVAKDLDQIFKSAMYISNVYEDDKNREIIQKCSFGALSAEQLASSVMHIDGDSWAKEQHREEVWPKQSQKALKMLSDWEKELKENKKIRSGDFIKNKLEKSLNDYDKGIITRKQLLDTMLAGEVQTRMTYPTNASKLFNFRQHNRARSAMLKCRTALGLSETMPLRSAMNEEYIRLANSMSKEQVFKAVERRMEYSYDFKTETLAFEKDHKAVQDREVAKRLSELEALKAKDKEPISIPQLDERKLILTSQPRVKPIVPSADKQRNLSINQ